MTIVLARANAAQSAKSSAVAFRCMLRIARATTRTIKDLPVTFPVSPHRRLADCTAGHPPAPAIFLIPFTAPAKSNW